MEFIFHKIKAKAMKKKKLLDQKKYMACEILIGE